MTQSSAHNTTPIYQSKCTDEQGHYWDYFKILHFTILSMYYMNAY